MSDAVLLDGRSLTIADVVRVARAGAVVRLAPDALERMRASRNAVEDVVARGDVVYGVNTGFGKLANLRVDPSDLETLQLNLIRSHSAAVGEPLDREVVRAIMLLRTNVLVQGLSGVRPVLAERLTEMINLGLHPRVPSQGSVGASGDLAPLSHLALVMIGEGEVASEEGRWEPAGPALRRLGVEPVTLAMKEGLSFINGTQAQTAMATLLVNDAEQLWRTAHVAAAMTLEAVRGTPVPFDARIHDARPHPEQQRSARLLRASLAGSGIRESHRENDPRVQDAYSLRCTPQILGAVGNTIAFARQTVEVELNAATDNPLVFGAEVLSGGNFHGQPIALAMDVLGVGLATLAGLTERRIERMMNPDLSSGLPPFLALHPGLESGLMAAHITTAALAAECRVLATPASIQSIPTEANQEDFVPMGMTAAWKLDRMLRNARSIVAVEIMAAAQGLEYLRPLRAGAGVERAYETLRANGVKPLSGDRVVAGDIERIAAMIGRGQFEPEEDQ